MKKTMFSAVLMVAILFTTTTANATVSLYVDAAPNAYGSGDYPAWQSNAFAMASQGTFVNMANSINPLNSGTKNFELRDEFVYSFGDLGKRLTWIYWLPNETISNLSGRFQISLTNVWDGVSSDFYKDYYGSTWLTPTKWENYNGGVIGTAGMAYWGAYGVNTQAALDADIASYINSTESWVFTAKLDGVSTSLTSDRAAPVPEPGTMVLFGVGMLGLAVFGKRRINKA